MKISRFFLFATAIASSVGAYGDTGPSTSSIGVSDLLSKKQDMAVGLNAGALDGGMALGAEMTSPYFAAHLLAIRAVLLDAFIADPKRNNLVLGIPALRLGPVLRLPLKFLPERMAVSASSGISIAPAGSPLAPAAGPNYPTGYFSLGAEYLPWSRIPASIYVDAGAAQYRNSVFALAIGMRRYF